MNTAALRKSLMLNQSDLALLLNVHPMTISKWERGLCAPDVYQTAMMARFDLTFKDAKLWLVTRGPVATIVKLMTSNKAIDIRSR